MPFGGNGIFTRVYQWVNDAALGTFVDATRTDTDSNDIATGLTNCVTRDGQSPWLANLPAGGFKLTGMGNGSASTDSVNYGQVFSTAGTFTGIRNFADGITFANGLAGTGNVTFTGGIVDMDAATSVLVPTATPGDNTTKAASTAFVTQAAFNAALPAIALGFLSSPDAVTVNFGTTHTGYAQNEVKGADIASAATINLATATGNLVHVTGTTTITAITIPSGAERTVVFDGILTLTNGASLILPTGANIVTAAGDTMRVRGDGVGIARVVGYNRANGKPLILSGMELLAVLTPTAAANVDALTTLTAAYDNTVIIGDGIKPAADDNFRLRFGNAGSADTGSNYAFSSGITSANYGALTTSITLTSTVTSAGQGLSFRLELENVNGTTTIKGGRFFGNLQSAAAPTYTGAVATFAYVAANAISGARFFWGGGNNFTATGAIYIYGYNKTAT